MLTLQFPPTPPQSLNQRLNGPTSVFELHFELSRHERRKHLPPQIGQLSLQVIDSELGLPLVLSAPLLLGLLGVVRERVLSRLVPDFAQHPVLGLRNEPLVLGDLQLRVESPDALVEAVVLGRDAHQLRVDALFHFLELGLALVRGPLHQLAHFNEEARTLFEFDFALDDVLVEEQSQLARFGQYVLFQLFQLARGPALSLRFPAHYILIKNLIWQISKYTRNMYLDLMRDSSLFSLLLQARLIRIHFRFAEFGMPRIPIIKRIFIKTSQF